ncbi:MAG: hypothetical protein ACYDIA_08545 [Candidatus Humimicrobiaceae bacterium]
MPQRKAENELFIVRKTINIYKKDYLKKKNKLIKTKTVDLF